ncbi:MAG: energy-coupling factor ABC transporter ATP-binding protein [Syntrophomonadaceae bacterium]|jgi:energy-coupling factor transport system ATP-binding protein
MKAVVVENLNYQYQPGGQLVLKDIDFHIHQGETVAIIGLSGCGKSTLCRCISGVIHHHRQGLMTGKVVVNGKNISDLRGTNALEVGMVFQDPDMQLFSPTVEDEIAFAPENLCQPPEEIRERVENTLNVLGISALRYANPYYLSGGEKHLVALAAVLALDPPVLILDEVMSQLDTIGIKKVTTVVEKLRDRGKTIIAVEHNLEAVAFAENLMILENGELMRFDRRDIILADREYLTAKRLIDI